MTILKRVILGAALAALLIAPAGAKLSPQEAAPGDLSLTVTSLLPVNGVISAHEPLIAYVKLTNLTAREVEFIPYDIALEIYDSRGRLVAATPRQDPPEDFRYTVKRIPPGGSITNTVVLSALYQFKQTGVYEVHLLQLIPERGTPVLTRAKIRVGVLPFDGPRLRARCDEIIAPLKAAIGTGCLPQGLGDFSSRSRRQAIYSIRHDAALPYLDLMAREMDSWSALVAMRRIGSKQSEALFEKFRQRQDRAGRSARLVAKESLRLYGDDYRDDWQPEPSPSK